MNTFQRSTGSHAHQIHDLFASIRQRSIQNQRRLTKEEVMLLVQSLSPVLS
jgi:hypothetical protein